MFYFPACLPSALTSLRLNVAVSIAVLYLAESFCYQFRSGYYIMDTWQRLDYTRLYAGVLAMSLIGALAFIILAYAEEKFCRWTQAGNRAWLAREGSTMIVKRVPLAEGLLAEKRPVGITTVMPGVTCCRNTAFSGNPRRNLRRGGYWISYRQRLAGNGTGAGQKQ
jgi:hypothetical protein